MQERRKNQRFDLRLPLQLILAGEASHPAGETKNVSSSGVLFTSVVRFKVGEPIEYMITFPRVPGTHSEVRLRCAGKVLRDTPETTFAATLESYEFVRKSGATTSRSVIDETGGEFGAGPPQPDDFD